MDPLFIRELIDIVGADYVSTSEDVRLTYSASASMGYDTVMPGAVVRPGSTEEVSQILRLANKYRVQVTPRSGGSSLQGEVIPRSDGLVIELLRLNDITLHEDLRSVTVGAGVTFGMLDKFLKTYDLWVPIYPESALFCTVAGNVAVNGAGPGSSTYGCIAEIVLGLEVVLPDGRVIRTGSETNPDAVGPFARYAFGPDLTGLFIGSLGSLGIITHVSLRVFKRMHYFDYNTYGFETAEQAEQFLLRLLDNDVSVLFVSIYEGRILTFFMDMLGSEYGVPKYEWPPYTVSATLGRLREDQLNSDIAVTQRICIELGGHVIGIRELPRGEWEDRMRTFVRSSYAHGWHWRMLYHHQPPVNWHRTVEETWHVLDKYGILGHTAGFLTSPSAYNFYLQLYWDPTDKEEEMKVRAAHEDLSRRLLKTGAVPFKLAPYWQHMLSVIGDYADILKLLKKTLDPNNIMNPGVLGGI